MNRNEIHFRASIAALFAGGVFLTGCLALCESVTPKPEPLPLRSSAVPTGKPGDSTGSRGRRFSADLAQAIREYKGK